MPTSLSIRNIDDDLIARLKRRAARHGRSAEAEHREIGEVKVILFQRSWAYATRTIFHVLRVSVADHQYNRCLDVDGTQDTE